MTKINYDALDAVLEAGGFKPVEPAGHWEPIEARDIKVGDKLRVSRVSGGCDWELGDEFEVTRTSCDRLTVTQYASMEAGRPLVAAYYGLEVWRTPTPVRTYEEGYADGSADAIQSALNQGYDKGFEEAALKRAAGVEAAASALEEAGLHRVTSYGGRVKLATRYRRHEPMGDWEILGPESVNVELRYLTAAQAAEVAHLVAGWGE